MENLAVWRDEKARCSLLNSIEISILWTSFPTKITAQMSKYMYAAIVHDTNTIIFFLEAIV